MKWLWFTFLVIFTLNTQAIEHIEGEFSLFEKAIPGLNKNGFDHYRDSKGFYWIATTGAIYRFDGNKLEAVFEDPKNGLISSTEVYQFVEQQGYLWASSYRGLFRIDLSNYQVKHFSALEHNIASTSEITTSKHLANEQLTNDSLANNNIRYLSKDAQQRLWISTLKGLSLYHPESETFSNYYLPTVKENTEYSQAFRRAASDSDGNLWISTYEQGLQILISDTQELKHINRVAKLSTQQQQWFQGGNVKDVASLANGRVGIALSDRYVEFDKNFALIHNIAIRSQHQQRKAATLYRILEDNTQRIWLSTFNQALVRISADRGKVEYHYHNPQDKNHSLRKEVPFRLTIDQQGNIALTYVNNNYQFWSAVNDKITRVAVPGNRLADSSVEVSQVMDGGFVWLGYRNNTVIYLLNLSNNSIEPFDIGTPLQSFAGINQHKVYISSATTGAFLFDTESQTKTNISNLAISSMEFSPQTGLWFSTENQVYRLHHGQVRAYPIEGVSTLLGAHIYNDPVWGTWVSTTDSLFYFDPNEDKFTHLSQERFNIINGTRILLHNDSLWIPGNGLTRLKLAKANGKTQISSTQSFPELDKEVFYNVTAKGDAIWLNNATGERIYRIDDHGSISKRFDIAQGFPRVSSTQVLALSESGDLLFSEKGEISLLSNPDSIQTGKSQTSKIISYAVLDQNQRLNYNFNPKRNINLGPDEKTIIFNFSTMSSSSRNIHSEEYRLIGRSPRWIRASSKTAVFSGLEPGEYSFELRNVWNQDDISRIKIYAKAPLWKTPIAYSLYALAVILVLLFIFYLRWDREKSKREAEAKIRLYAKAFESAAEGFCVVDARSRILNSNDSFKNLMGSEPHSLLLCRSNNVSQQEYYKNWASLVDKGIAQGKTWCRTQSGAEIPLSYTGSIIEHYDNDNPLYMIVLSDISAQLQHEKELETMSNYDSLTGLANRNLFREKLKSAIRNYHHLTGKKFGILYLDIDRFKTVNNSLSYHYGDKLLLELGKKLNKALRPQDSLCRMGGDEFVAIVENIDSPELLGNLSDKLIKTSEQAMLLAESEIFVSLSVGIAIFPDDSRDPEELIKQADAARYSAKAKGGGNYSYFSSSMSSRLNTALKLESEIRQAVRNNEFIPYYQPKICLETGKMVGVEALVRWCKPDSTIIMPGVFIDAAERTGAIVKIGLQVLHHACQLLERWHTEGFEDIKIAVNISAHQLAQDNFIEDVKKVLTQYEFDYRMIEFEITESILMADKSDSVLKLSILREMGHSISVDDFGTGYSSLAYLTELPIDTLKIDQSFVKNMLRDEKQKSVVKTIIELSNNLELSVVAEGVETEDDHCMLKSLHCHFGQGYWYAKPMSAKDLCDSHLFADLQI